MTTRVMVLIGLAAMVLAARPQVAHPQNGENRAFDSKGASPPSQLWLLEARQVPDRTSEVDRIFREWDSDETPGCAVGVSRDGQPSLERGYGMADLEFGVPITPTTIFEPGSVSKQFAAAPVVLLALDGVLSLDDDVRDYVPELPDYGEPITVRDLITHTSGLRDWGSVAALSGWDRRNRVHTHAHVLDIVSRQQALNYPPGERYSYTNSGYNLLAIIVDRVTEEGFVEFTRRRFFEPLGMESTSWRDDYQRLVPGRATAYSPGSGGTFQANRPDENVYGNAALLTTVRDLLAWTENLESGRIGGPEFVELMHTRARLTNGQEIAYAGGLVHGSRHGVPTVGHSGGTAGYGAYLVRYPEQRLGVAVMCNVSAASSGSLANEVADLYLAETIDVAAEPESPEGVDVPASDLQAKAGLYASVRTGDPLRLEFSGGALRIRGGAPLVPRSSTEFQVGAGEQRLTFEAVDGGYRIFRSGADSGDETYEPVPEFNPSREELAHYAGTYRSDEAETELSVAVEGGTLVIHRRPGDRWELEPVHPDAFDSSLGLVRFHPGGGRGISELGIGQGRIHDIRFRRVVP